MWKFYHYVSDTMASDFRVTSCWSKCYCSGENKSHIEHFSFDFMLKNSVCLTSKAKENVLWISGQGNGH